MNLAASKHFDAETIQKNINSIRNEFEVDIPCSGDLVMDKDIKKNNENFAKLLQISNISEYSVINLTESDIQTGGEMFVALNVCPSFHLRLYKKAITGDPSRIGMLSVSILKKAPQNFKLKAMKIYEKIISVLGYRYINVVDDKAFRKLQTNLSHVKAEDFNQVQTVSNHPVHILDKNGNLSPSSLIPFCSFGDNLSLVGTKLDDFDFPVCTIFEPKVHYDQLCYQADLEKYRESNNLLRQIRMGFTFLIDYNEERQLKSTYYSNENSQIGDRRMFDFDVGQTFNIFLNTISNVSLTERWSLRRDWSFAVEVDISKTLGGW